MNKITVQYLIREIVKNLEADNTYSNFIDSKQVAEFTLSRSAIITQAKNAVGLKRTDKSAESKAIESACTKFFTEATRTLHERDIKGRYKVEHIKSTRNVLSILVTGPNSNSDSLRWVSSVISPHRAALLNKVESIAKASISRSFLNVSQGAGASNVVLRDIVNSVEKFFNYKPSARRTEIDSFVLDVTQDLTKLAKRSAPIHTASLKSDGRNYRTLSNDIAEATYNAVSKAATDYNKEVLVKKVSNDISKTITSSLKGSKSVSLSGFKPVALIEKSSSTKKIQAKSTISTVDQSRSNNDLLDRPSNIDLKAIMRQVNLALPSIIYGNMGHSPSRRKQPPGTPLNWRTGRLARSMQVTDIDLLQDTPVVEYTYMEEPYSIFEPGSGSSLASNARDPRGLADKSIRQALAGLLKSRFITERKFR